METIKDYDYYNCRLDRLLENIKVIIIITHALIYVYQFLAFLGHIYTVRSWRSRRKNESFSLCMFSCCNRLYSPSEEQGVFLCINNVNYYFSFTNFKILIIIMAYFIYIFFYIFLKICKWFLSLKYKRQDVAVIITIISF